MSGTLRIAVLGQGTRGDLYPLLGVARSLVARSHAVDVLEYDEYRHDVVTAGLSFVRVGVGSQCARVFANVPEGPATARTEWVTGRLYCEASLDSAAAFVRATSQLSPGPDAIVAPAHHIGATLAGELLRIPVVPVFLGPSVLQTTANGRDCHELREVRLIDRFVMPRIARIRSSLGMAPGPAEASFARVDRTGGLVLTPAVLVDSPESVTPAFDVAGYPDYFGPETDCGTPGLRQFLSNGDEPVVVCSLGDGWARALPEQLRRLSAHAEVAPFRLVVLGGRMPKLAAGPMTRVTSAVNLRCLLRSADVVVHHGGMGSVVAALRGAVPSVTMSQWPDGRRNATALARLGLSIDLGSHPSSAQVVGAVHSALAEDGWKARLALVRDAMQAEPDPADVLLRRLVREGAG